MTKLSATTAATVAGTAISITEIKGSGLTMLKSIVLETPIIPTVLLA
jgi:hypothetical protein